MMLKKGDILICHSKLIFGTSHTVNNLLTVNKQYKVCSSDEVEFYIRNNRGEIHYFSLLKSDQSYYGNWFYSPRKCKLERLDKLNKLDRWNLKE